MLEFAGISRGSCGNRWLAAQICVWGALIGCAPSGSRNNTLLRRVLRRFVKGSASLLLRRVLERNLVWDSVGTEVLRRVLRRGGGAIEGASMVLRRQKHPKDPTILNMLRIVYCYGDSKSLRSQ